MRFFLLILLFTTNIYAENSDFLDLDGKSLPNLNLQNHEVSKQNKTKSAIEKARESDNLNDQYINTKKIKKINRVKRDIVLIDKINTKITPKDLKVKKQINKSSFNDLTNQEKENLIRDTLITQKLKIKNQLYDKDNFIKKELINFTNNIYTNKQSIIKPLVFSEFI